MAEIGTAIVGDGKYTCDREVPVGLALGLHLHARALRLPSGGGKPIEIVAELPEHMKKTFDVLGFDEDSAENFFDLKRVRRPR
jgi:23S rRNA pseudouridine955/2504/2580 synthase